MRESVRNRHPKLRRHNKRLWSRPYSYRTSTGCVPQPFYNFFDTMDEGTGSDVPLLAVSAELLPVPGSTGISFGIVQEPLPYSNATNAMLLGKNDIASGIVSVLQCRCAQVFAAECKNSLSVNKQIKCCA
jgi:hypothetical protein